MVRLWRRISDSFYLILSYLDLDQALVTRCFPTVSPTSGRPLFTTESTRAHHTTLSLTILQRHSCSSSRSYARNMIGRSSRPSADTSCPVRLLQVSVRPCHDTLTPPSFRHDQTDTVSILRAIFVLPVRKVSACSIVNHPSLLHRSRPSSHTTVPIVGFSTSMTLRPLRMTSSRFLE
jgi:hypothetical protein